MKLYVDENLPPHLAHGFQVLLSREALKTGVEVEIIYLPDAFGAGAKDIDWIPKVGASQGCVLTQDVKIQRRKQEQELYRQHSVGMFFLRGRNKKEGLTVWRMVEILAKNWPSIEKAMLIEDRPFAFEVSDRRLNRL